MKKYLLLCLALLIMTPVMQAQDEEPLADRLTDMLKSDVFNLGILLQSKGVFSFDDNSFLGGRKFDMGATRLDFRGVVDQNFIYRLQLDLRQRPSILDAQVGYLIGEDHRIVAGAYKPNLSRELDPSPGNTDFINRARQVGAMMNSRDIGVTFVGVPDQWSYAFGIYNGTGLSRQNDNRFMYTGRLAYESELDEGVINVGMNLALNQTRFEAVGNSGLVSEGNRTLYGFFADFESRDLFGGFEFLQTRFDALDFGGDTETISGFYLTLGSDFTEKDQMLVRWDHLSFDLSDRRSDRFILGWNHQATRLISFKANLTGQFDKGGEKRYGAEGVMQFQF